MKLSIFIVRGMTGVNIDRTYWDAAVCLSNDAAILRMNRFDAFLNEHGLQWTTSDVHVEHEWVRYATAETRAQWPDPMLSVDYTGSTYRIVVLAIDATADEIDVFADALIALRRSL